MFGKTRRGNNRMIPPAPVFQGQKEEVVFTRTQGLGYLERVGILMTEVLLSKWMY